MKLKQVKYRQQLYEECMNLIKRVEKEYKEDGIVTFNMVAVFKDGTINGFNKYKAPPEIEKIPKNNKSKHLRRSK